MNTGKPFSFETHNFFHFLLTTPGQKPARLIVKRKVHTKCNPADICTKQEGISAEVFEKHVRVILGETDEVAIDININNVVAHFIIAGGEPEMVSIVRDPRSRELQCVVYDL